ncbi:Hypothetical protein PHPALM_6927 [Phytophthora palmivora]|uniref:Uncharacterized protein n=1 Tax=Phytophthora palmivora TaxID=4796 RepID=A0A2P4YDM1_9STRA|nr:Hypothetical protein PHPALM_6927 [Phytophthora palmivora]
MNVAVDTEQMRPEYFWDDLEAAAEIVQWENEHMAEVALVQPPAKTSNDIDQLGFKQQIVQNKPKMQPLAVSTISQELAAAAEIIQWENEHEVSPEVTAFDDSSKGDPGRHAPQFQLLPEHATDGFERHKQNAVESKCPLTNNITSRLQSKSNSQRKRLLVESPPAPPHFSATPGGSNQRPTTSSYPSENHQDDPTVEFIDKHILEDKFEVPVLEFLDMMLA